MKKKVLARLLSSCVFFACLFIIVSGCGIKRTAEMSSQELSSYMVDLAEKGRFREAAAVSEQYLEKGAYFAGLGLFASTVAEKNGKRDKAVLYAFLDYEFLRSGSEVESDVVFLEGLAELDQFFAENPAAEDGRNALQLVRSCFDSSTEYESLQVIDSFVYSYIVLKNKVRDKKAGIRELGQLLALEKYFTRFPSYYWCVWKLFESVPGTPISSAISCLEKIILRRPNSAYAEMARDRLTSFRRQTNE